MKKLSKEQVLHLHKDLIDEFGGSHGVRDNGLLESALNAPFQSFEGQEFYPSVVLKAARLGYGLIQNHPFIDGNKRIGTHAMLVFLAINHIEFLCDDDDLIHEILGIADHSVSFDDFSLWVSAHILITG